MKWEGGPSDVKCVAFPQTLNTTRDEIAPGSDIVGKDFQYRCFSHCLAPSILLDKKSLILFDPLNFISSGVKLFDWRPAPHPDVC
jgi:hypothetical protein